MRYAGLNAGTDRVYACCWMAPTALSGLADDDVDQLVRDDDHLGDLVPVEMGLDAAGLEAQFFQLLAPRPGGCIHPVADLAVDLANELERVGLAHVGIGVGPRLLPPAPAGEHLVSLGPEVRREREQQRRGGRGRESPRLRIG